MSCGDQITLVLPHHGESRLREHAGEGARLYFVSVSAARCRCIAGLQRWLGSGIHVGRLMFTGLQDPIREVEVLLPVVGGYVVTSGADVIADCVAD